MTPAVRLAETMLISFRLHEYHHDAKAESYGLEAAEKLDVPATSVFKTLVVQFADKTLGVAVLPVTEQLNLKLIAKAAGQKKAAMADKKHVQASTGYVLGGVSPLAQKKPLPTFIDFSAQALDSLYVSAGRRGLEIELKAEDLGRLTQAKFIALSQSS